MATNLHLLKSRERGIRNSITKVFIDADAFVALYYPKDPHYAKALSISNAIKDMDGYTSYFVLGEAATVISKYTSLQNASVFIEIVLVSELTIFSPDHSLFVKGKEVFERQTSKNFRFSDAVNIALIKEHGIDAVFSFDNHYKQNGITRVGIDG